MAMKSNQDIDDVTTIRCNAPFLRYFSISVALFVMLSRDTECFVYKKNIAKLMVLHCFSRLLLIESFPSPKKVMRKTCQGDLC